MCKDRAVKGTRLVELNWIRGLACIAVMLFHYTTRYDQIFGRMSELWLYCNWGGSCVIVFFTLSGFLSAFTMNDDLTFVKYMLKRFVRLYPVYWICMFLTIAVMLFCFPLYHQLPDSSIDIKTVVVNMTMLQGFFGVDSIDGAYWTLSYELRFYCFMLIVLLMKGNKHLKQWAFLWLGLSFAVIVARNYWGASFVVKGIIYLIMPSYAASFIVGIMLCFLLRNIKDVAAYLGIFAAMLLAYCEQRPSYFTAQCVCVLGIYLIVLLRSSAISESYGMLVAKLERRGFGVLSKVAAVSFPIYLLHQHIGYAIIWRMEQIGLHNEVFLAIPIIVVFVLAWFVQKRTDEILSKKVYKDQEICR